MKWTLRNKILGLFLSSTLLSLIGFGVGLRSSTQVSSTYEGLIDDVKVERRNSDDLAKAIEVLRYEELNYFSTRSQDSKSAIIKSIEAIQSLSNTKEISDGHIKAKLAIIHQQAETLAQSVQAEFALFEREGTKDSGLLGEIRKLAHSIEEKIKTNRNFNREKAQISYLNLRRNEKDFLARRDGKYIEKIKEEKERFFRILGPRGSKAKGNGAIIKDYQSYLSTFEKLEKSDKDLRTQRVQTQKNLEELEKSRKDVYTLLTDELLQAEARAEDSMRNMHYTLISGLILLVLTALVAASQIHKTSTHLQAISRVISEANAINQSLSANLSTDSNRLSEAVNEQAASLEETSATLTKIESMVQRSPGHADDSREKSRTNETLARQSQDSLKELHSSLSHLSLTSENLEKNIQKSNERYSGIIEIIRQIIAKTQVINDIVLQSRLLSFNASVEAARAGEQGKGFAVVATEVGQLASLSGSAAREISELLASSKSDVEEVVQDSEALLKEMSQAIKLQVESGLSIASRCQAQIEQVYGHSQKVRQSMDEIRSASKEQAEGVENINHAMHGIEAAVSESANLAQNSANAADELSQQAEKLNQAVQKLELMLTGREYPIASVHRFPRPGAKKAIEPSTLDNKLSKRTA